jgi:hypothetical protein
LERLLVGDIVFDMLASDEDLLLVGAIAALLYEFVVEPAGIPGVDGVGKA